MTEAKQADDLRTAVAAVGQARGVLDLLAKVAGEIGDGSTSVNININPVILELQTIIVTALEPFPEARYAVAAALKRASLDG